MSGSATPAPAETEAQRIARLEKEVREYHQKRREDAETAATASVKPVADFYASAQFKTVMEKAREARSQMNTAPELFNLLNSLVTIMENIEGATERARQAFIQSAQETPAAS